MSEETATTDSAEMGIGLEGWQAGIAGGIAGAIVMAALISVMNPPTITKAIPALYGLSGGLLGWVVHVSHGAVLGLVYAAIDETGVIELDSAPKSIGLGLVWGVATWAVLAALVMPVWLGAVGFPAVPPLPNFAPPSLLWHVVYGGVLGVAYPLIR